MMRHVLLIAAASIALAACGFPETKMEPLENHLQPASQPAAAQQPGDQERAKQSKSQPAANRPSG
jgi:hypothetical protein